MFRPFLAAVGPPAGVGIRWELAVHRILAAQGHEEAPGRKYEEEERNEQDPCQHKTHALSKRADLSQFGYQTYHRWD